MQMALDSIAFLPFGKLIDEWRWGVFSGEITPDNYNQAWWDLREKYQGIAPPVERTEADFDPGAKYHIPANVSYTRYFLARILQFQFQRSLCETPGTRVTCTPARSTAARRPARSSTPCWQPARASPGRTRWRLMTGTREMDATAIIDYFAPLMGYLKEQNEERSCGW